MRLVLLLRTPYDLDLGPKRDQDALDAGPCFTGIGPARGLARRLNLGMWQRLVPRRGSRVKTNIEPPCEMANTLTWHFALSALAKRRGGDSSRIETGCCGSCRTWAFIFLPGLKHPVLCFRQHLTSQMHVAKRTAHLTRRQVWTEYRPVEKHAEVRSQIKSTLAHVLGSGPAVN